MLLNNVKLMWCKVGSNAGTKYGSEEKEWSVDCICSDEQSKNWVESQHATKERVTDDGEKFIKLTKNLVKRDGNPAQSIKVIDKHGKDVDPLIVGNGSKANVQYTTFEWEMAGRSGVKAILTALQITDLVEYSGHGTSEFEIEEQPEIALEKDEVF
jgi:hypothetical protein